jgi:hypothetical protein
MPGTIGDSAETQEQPGIEKELGDRSRGAGVELALQVIEVEFRAWRLGMHFGVSRDRDVEVCNFPQSRDEIGRICITAGRRQVFPAAGGRITAQRHEVANAHIPVFARNIVDLLPARINAGQVRSDGEVRFINDALDDVMGAFSRRSIRPVGHGDEVRRERLKPLDRFPQSLLHLLGVRREELKGNLDVFGY